RFVPESLSTDLRSRPRDNVIARQFASHPVVGRLAASAVPSKDQQPHGASMMTRPDAARWGATCIRFFSAAALSLSTSVLGCGTESDMGPHSGGSAGTTGQSMGSGTAGGSQTTGSAGSVGSGGAGGSSDSDASVGSGGSATSDASTQDRTTVNDAPGADSLPPDPPTGPDGPNAHAFRIASGTLNVDYPGYFAKHDITYAKPNTNPLYGLTVGNGRMGAMVWSANGITMQVGGVDASEQAAFASGLL